MEKDAEALLRQEIEARGGLCWKFTSPGQDGVPDRMVIVKDRAIFVELKTSEGKLKKIQAHQILRLLQRYIQVCVVYGRQGVLDFLEDLDRYVVSSHVYGGPYDGESTEDFCEWVLQKGGDA